MEWETFLWTLSLLVTGILVFWQVFQLICFADLESDYINPIDLCSRLNTFILPEVVAHGILTVLFLLSGFWLEFLFNLPLVGWHLNRFQTKKLNLDPTSIFSTLNQEKNQAYAKLAFYLLFFFFFLYRLIYTLIKEVVGTNAAGNLIRDLY